MGIWRVLSATMLCDTCDTLLAYIEFDAADTINIERVRVKCPGCKKAEDAKEEDQV